MRANPNDTFLPTAWVKAGSQVTITIGRNVKDEPLDDTTWHQFQQAISRRLDGLLKPSQVFGPFTGTGEWEGVTEESAVVILLTQYTTNVAHVVSILTALAEDYGQDAIAWSYGPNHLVYV